MDINHAYVWGGLFAVGFLYEMYTIFNKEQGDTLSETIRNLITTYPGIFAFSVAWLAFSLWFLFHIVGKMK